MVTHPQTPHSVVVIGLCSVSRGSSSGGNGRSAAGHLENGENSGGVPHCTGVRGTW